MSNNNINLIMSRYPSDSKIDTFLNSCGIKKINHHTKSIDLIKNSKQLILNNRLYEQYSNYYTHLTTTFSFKRPDVTDYPLQRNHCIISLQKSHRKKHKTFNLISHSPKPTFPSINSEHRATRTRRTIDESKSKQESDCVNKSSLYRLIDQFNNMNSVIYKYINYKEKYALMIDKTNHSLLSELLKADKYTHEVFNEIGKKENTFYVNDDTIKVTLACNSIQLIFYELEKATDKSYIEYKTSRKTYRKAQEILFPFELIPLLYGLPYEETKLFLSLIISYDNDKSIFGVNKKAFDKFYALLKDKTDLFKESSLFCRLNDKEHLIQLEYHWITRDKLYIAKIKLPHHSFKITYIQEESLTRKSPVTIEKTIGIQYMMYFFKIQFKDWDLYLMNSLSVYKNFRDVVNQALSKNPLRLPKRKIVLNPPTRRIDDLSESAWNFFFSNSDGNCDYITLNSLKIVLVLYENEYHTEDYKTIVLSMNQTCRLLRLRQLFPIEGLLKRCISFDKSSPQGVNVSFCFNTLELFDDAYCHYLMELKDSIEIKETIEKERMYEIAFIEPLLEWKFSVMNEFNKKTYVFPKEVSNSFMNSPPREWDKYLQIKIPQIYDETIVFKVNESIMDFKKKLIDNPKRKITSKLRIKMVGKKTVLNTESVNMPIK